MCKLPYNIDLYMTNPIALLVATVHDVIINAYIIMDSDEVESTFYMTI